MIIKKYQAANETDAIILAKEELGKNVIIMNVKKVNPKGIARIFKKSRVEVTAAIDDGKSYKDAVEKADKEALVSIKTEDKDVSSNKSKDKNKKNNTKIFKMKKDEEDLKAMYSKELDETENKVQKAKAKKAEVQKDELDNSSKEKLEEQLFKVLAQKQEEISKDSLNDKTRDLSNAKKSTKDKTKFLTKEISDEFEKQEIPKKDELDEEIKEELREEIFRAIQQKQESMARKNELKKEADIKRTESQKEKVDNKKEIEKANKKGAEIVQDTEKALKETKVEKVSTKISSKDDKSDKYVKLIKKQLLKHEVDEKYIDMIINEVKGNIKKDTLVDNILTSVYQKIILKLGTPKLIEPGKDSPKYIFFMGPTGVGKTTTIAKIASDFSLNRGLNVALLTSDTYRIAAVEQLRIFANILKTPIHVAYSAEDIRKLKKELDKYDVVLIDTAGRSHKNAEQNKDLRELISAIDSRERDMYLVLSATTKYTDLISIIDAYKDIENYKLLFTKTDETMHLGNILNIKLLTNADLSYIANGQDVPKDIGKVDAQDIAKQLLGGGM